MEVLQVDSIRKSFRGDLSLTRREVLHGVSFTAFEGEILGFLGPNGAGKTTTIKIVLGLIRPDSGKVTLFDRPSHDEGAKARIGYLPERPYFYPQLTLREFLVFCGQLSGMEQASLKSRVEEVTDRVDLGGSIDARLRGFSKGMIQRAGLAQAILHDPDLLILDEPFSGLDPLGRIMVRDVLLELKRRKKTIFFSSHILPDMEALCDRTCIIREGVIVRCAELDELTRIGEREMRITARGCGPDCFDALGDYITTVNTSGDESSCVVKEHRYVRTVIQYLYAHGAEILRVANQYPSLEEVFLDEVSRPREPRVDGEREKTKKEEFITSRAKRS